MAPLLREADRREIAAMSGEACVDALMRGLEGDVCLTALTGEGNPMLMFGVAPSPHPGAGYVWLLGTDQIKRYVRVFLDLAPAYIDSLHDIYPLLHNYVDARNEVHIRWLRWLGCTFIQTHDRMGVQERPFHEFVRIRKINV